MNIIKVEHLTRTFGDIRAVDGVSFAVSAGEIFAFLGPNGAGKTTTIKMLTTLLHPTAGTMRINGHDPVSEQDAVRRSPRFSPLCFARPCRQSGIVPSRGPSV